MEDGLRAVPVDDMGRRFASLRLSLTARCNFACQYCVPDARRLVAADAELSVDEMVRAVELLVQRGIVKLRITGGEPLLSAKLEPLLQRLADLPFEDRALTSNGALLADKMPILVRGGIKRVNVSLDSLQPDRFARLSRGGDLRAVLAGIDSALAAGLKVRVNTVLMRGENDGEILPLLKYGAEKNLEVRFLELMQMGHLHGSPVWRQQWIGQDEILDRIGEEYRIEPARAPTDATARRWRILGTGSHFGIIANTSAPFCAGCDRLRLTSDGYLYGCISSSERLPLRPILSQPMAIAQVQLDDLLSRALRVKSRSGFDGERTVMKFLGG